MMLVLKMNQTFLQKSKIKCGSHLFSLFTSQNAPNMFLQLAPLTQSNTDPKYLIQRSPCGLLVPTIFISRGKAVHNDLLVIQTTWGQLQFFQDRPEHSLSNNTSQILGFSFSEKNYVDWQSTQHVLNPFGTWVMSWRGSSQNLLKSAIQCTVTKSCTDVSTWFISVWNVEKTPCTTKSMWIKVYKNPKVLENAFFPN